MYIDLFISVILIWAVFSGWRNGFIKEVFSTLGIIVGLLVATALYFYLAGDYFAIKGSETNQVLNIAAFLILWIVLPLGLGLVANILTVAVKGMQLGYPNSILGTVFSLAKFVLLLSCILNMMGHLHILEEDKVKDSKLYQPLVGVLPFVNHEAKVMYDKSDLRKTKGDTIWVEAAPRHPNQSEDN